MLLALGRSLRLEVDRLQEQLKVLVNNLAILNNQAACQPHNTTINYQINKVSGGVGQMVEVVG